MLDVVDVSKSYRGVPAVRTLNLSARPSGIVGLLVMMIVAPMIPEAFEEAHEFAGLVTVLGFLAAFALSKLGG